MRDSIAKIATPQTWTDYYSDGLVELIDFLIRRIEPYTVNGLDVDITYERLPISSITVRNEARRKHAQNGLPNLRQFLSSFPSMDSLPIVCARNVVGKVAVWDGHHRLRTYELVGRQDVPSFVANFSRGNGGIVTVAGEAA